MSKKTRTSAEWAVQEIMSLIQEYDDTASNLKEIYKGIDEDFIRLLREELDELIADKVNEENLCPRCFDYGDEVELGIIFENVFSEYWGNVKVTREPVGSICPYCRLVI